MTENKVQVAAAVKRGPESWQYVYVMLGFALTIEGSIIQMITPLIFPGNLLVFAVVGVVTFWLFIDSRWFQNKLIGLKIKFEEKAH